MVVQAAKDALDTWIRNVISAFICGTQDIHKL
jgi:hypothetical protein